MEISRHFPYIFTYFTFTYSFLHKIINNCPIDLTFSQIEGIMMENNLSKCFENLGLWRHMTSHYVFCSFSRDFGGKRSISDWRHQKTGKEGVKWGTFSKSITQYLSFKALSKFFGWMVKIWHRFYENTDFLGIFRGFRPKKWWLQPKYDVIVTKLKFSESLKMNSL